jgi:alanine dehydrogenase
MVVGVPKEIKVAEQRVALTPAGARAFSDAGHGVLVETGAGAGSGFRDEEYAAAGAQLSDVAGVWDKAELVLKVKEPIEEEVARIREGQTLFTYLHLAAMPDLVRAFQARGVLAIAYETVERADGSLPLLTPMSEVAGRLAVQEGAHYLGRAYGGRGIMLSGVPGAPPATWSSSEPGPWVSTPPGSPSAWAPTCRCSTSTSTGCATPTLSSAAAS